MNGRSKITVFVLVFSSLFGIPGVAAASSSEAMSTTSVSAMEIAAMRDASVKSEAVPESRRIVGVAKAVNAGFKAAGAYRAAAQVLAWGSLLGHIDSLPEMNNNLQAAYFDR